ncbi:hypothetical protein N7462_004125 [Penicillium macrosclerotiorum]|uniref:uncharacterized protein n=1 Tax=Penicillium macrosclerotiorum TaxID=303699 RepID=UPI0025491638|nr:uncharacterized protein N7462_004125 [Penicillium macrosclerotiorum]KAJ5689733.1 hypothetical protein N7462_004125 [Penicillium macrosclerotiorum]
MTVVDALIGLVHPGTPALPDPISLHLLRSPSPSLVRILLLGRFNVPPSGTWQLRRVRSHPPPPFPLDFVRPGSLPLVPHRQLRPPEAPRPDETPAWSRTRPLPVALKIPVSRRHIDAFDPRRQPAKESTGADRVDRSQRRFSIGLRILNICSSFRQS